MKKTAKEWLEELPEPYRSQALENVESCPYRPSEIVSNLHYGISNSFHWEDTPQKWGYWGDVRDMAKNGEFDRVNDGAVVPPTKKQVNGSHYKDMAIQPSEFIVKNNIGWYEGNAIKYLCRHAKKGGKIDLEKAIHYIELAMKEYYE